MPESRKRKKAYATPKATQEVRKKGPSPVWLAPLMLVLFGVGVLWLVTFYISQQEYPISGLGNGNLLVGFAFIIAGFGLSTQWR